MMFNIAANWKNNVLLLYGLSLLAALLTEGSVTSPDLIKRDQATIEIEYFEEDVPAFVAYKAILRIPEGSIVDTHWTGTYEFAEDEIDFLLSHRMSQAPFDMQREGAISDSGIVTQYYGPRNEGPEVNSLSDFILIPGSGLGPIEPIENYEEYIYLPKPGVHGLAEGETFILSDVAGQIFDVRIVKIAE